MDSPGEPEQIGAGSVRRSAAAIMLALAAAACVSLPVPALTGLAAPAPIFAPESFFAGNTEGVGTVRILALGSHALNVLGTGREEPDGTIVLDQRVEEAGKPPKQREWRIRQTSPGHYAGTLSDATGPILGDVDGNLLQLSFRMSGGLQAEQRLYLQPDGRTVLNRMTVRKLGVVVAVLSETIRKIG